MKQDFKVLKVMYESGETLTPKDWSKLMKLPTPTVRKHCKYWFELGVIKQSKMPFQSHRPEYFTTDALLKSWITKMKKEKRKLQCRIADRKYKNKHKERLSCS